MITRPTVLVLGAGASCDCSFPTAWGLKKRILDLPQNADTMRSMQALGNNPADCSAFSKSFLASGRRSIDDFLATRSDLEEIGRRSIAAALIPCERSAEVVKHRQNPTWLNLLVDSMGAGAESPDAWRGNKLSIVTFNYDRVVEHFLFTSLVHSFRLSDADAAQLLHDTVKIVHVHGQLGAYPGLSGGHSRPFRPSVNSGELAVAANGILLARSGAAPSDEVKRARVMLGEAAAVAFLGFSYGQGNLELLNAGGTCRGRDDRPAFGSAMGMTLWERRQVETAIPGIQIQKDDATLDHFLRQNPILI
jgi:hypothetical protein